MRRVWVMAAAVLLVWASPARADLVSAMEAVKGQSRVVDVKTDNAGTLYVTVKPAKGDWSQYALGLCRVVQPHQARIFAIRVVDVTKAIFSQPPAAWPRLSEAICGGR